MSEKLISIIIPALNEEKGIKEVINRCKRYMKDIPHEIIVVDNNSTDKTSNFAKKAGAKVILEKRKGYGRAIRTGVEKSKGKIIVFLDGDSTYSPEYVPEMIEQLKNCNIVIGSRYLAKDTANELPTFIEYRIFPIIFNWIFKKFKTSEPFSGMRVMRKSDWNELSLRSNDFLLTPEIEVESIKKGFKIVEIPVPCLRRRGKSKWLRSPDQWLRYYRFIKKNEKYFKRNAKIYRVVDYSTGVQQKISCRNNFLKQELGSFK